jgi:flagellar biosynthesis protein FliQ
MTPMEAITLGQEAMNLTLLLSAPLLAVGMGVGILIALFQAVTQIQEMTLTFVPKIVAIMLSLLFLSSWMLIKLTDYTESLFLRLPELIR